mmetsp:Transcript_15359/g.35521  ORF Transcript_15359/g.35521 Transcript_15359/m.35521 type:complete len:207 (-) Transcript_15359:849-1469(-)
MSTKRLFRNSTTGSQAASRSLKAVRTRTIGLLPARTSFALSRATRGAEHRSTRCTDLSLTVMRLLRFPLHLRSRHRHHPCVVCSSQRSPAKPLQSGKRQQGSLLLTNNPNTTMLSQTLTIWEKTHHRCEKYSRWSFSQALLLMIQGTSTQRWEALVQRFGRTDWQMTLLVQSLRGSSSRSTCKKDMRYCTSSQAFTLCFARRETTA